MKVYVYWNRKDNDCKKIFHFMSPNDDYSIVQDLEEKSDLNLNRVYQAFTDKTSVFKGIESSDLIIFLTHGTEREILKYLNKPLQEKEEYVLLDKQNISILKGKIVLAFCCATARELGPYAVQPVNGCKTYIGFEKDIVYDNGNALKSRNIIYSSYKKAFAKAIKYAVTEKCTAEDFKIKLVQMLRKESVEAALSLNDHTLHNMYSGTIDSVVALGDKEAILFA